MTDRRPHPKNPDAVRCLCLTVFLLLGGLSAAHAQLFGDVAKDPTAKKGGWSIQAQIGAAFGLPTTDAKYQYTYPLSTRPSTLPASPSPYVTVPVEVSGQYQFGEHIRLGAGLKRFGIKLSNGNADLGQKSYDVRGSATVPFVRADILFMSSSKGGYGLGLQAGKALIGGSLMDGQNGLHFSLPVFYEIGITESMFFKISFSTDYTTFDHKSWFGTGEQVHTSVLGVGVNVGLLYKL